MVDAEQLAEEHPLPTSTWEDFLSTLGTALRDALRDAERIKDQISSEIDMTRIRSAFNCQEPDRATLSAEQIYVEHAIEQVKSSLNCRNVDIDDLRAHEEVIGQEPIEEAEEEEFISAAEEPLAEQPTVIAEQPPVNLVDLSAEVQHVPADQPTVIAEKPPVDLLDLSAPVQHVPAAQDEKPSEQALVDLFDIPLDEDAEPQAAGEVQAPADLLDMQAPVKSAEDEINELPAIIANSSEKAPMDLLDVSAMPVSKGANEVAPTDYQSLLHLSQSLVKPVVNAPVAQAASETGPPDLL